MPDEALLARIDRLESLDEIRQLAAKYSLAFSRASLLVELGISHHQMLAIIQWSVTDPENEHI